MAATSSLNLQLNMCLSWTLPILGATCLWRRSIYADAGKSDDSAQIRKLMRDRGIKKKRVFYMGDLSCDQMLSATLFLWVAQFYPREHFFPQ
jgi:hypothetical protein